MKKVLGFALCGLVIFSGCSTMSKTGKGALWGTGAGLAAGAGIGALIGGERGAMIGAAIGTAVGAGTGAVIGDVMDKKAKDLTKKLRNATVELVKDANGLDAIKVTFDSGILFATGKSNLSDAAKTSLKDFTEDIADLPNTNLTVWGHTDNTGTAAANEKVSLQRAESVSAYLQECGISANRITAEGKSFNLPVADNKTEAGRAQNRRVELYVSADKNMVRAVENSLEKQAK